jgi:Zn finger protein HypA/HybF involved in hydrogenase expression
LSRLKTNKEFLNDLKVVNKDIIALEEYKGNRSPIKFKCLTCGYEWITTPVVIISNKCKCPNCTKNKVRDLFSLGIDEFKIKVNDLIGDRFDIVGAYINNQTDIDIKCNKCGNTFKRRPSNFLTTPKCPICEGKICIDGYNNLSITHPKLAKFLANEADGHEHTFHSGGAKKLLWKCPTCNSLKYATINYINKYGFMCNTCSDNISLPNKFITSIISEFTSDFFTEKTFDWSDSRRYDMYVPKYNIIIEMHGIQHYEECKFTSRTLAEEQENDKYKEQLAKDNWIINYIVIDCRDTNLDYMRNSILRSHLKDIYNIKELDWNKCYLNANKNIFKSVCHDYVQAGLKIYQLSEKYKLHTCTIRDYLIKGNSIGICNYVPIIGRNQSS